VLFPEPGRPAKTTSFCDIIGSPMFAAGFANHRPAASPGACALIASA